jgi:DNA repair exonuclease SbcCD nuclease subunit
MPMPHEGVMQTLLLPGGFSALAATADLHSEVYLLNSQFREELKKARLSGIKLLILAGDITHKGIPVEAYKIIQTVSQESLQAVAITGNHDWLSGKREELSRAMEDAGAVVLDNQVIVITEGEGDSAKKICVLGFDGSVSVEQMEQIKSINDHRAKQARFESATRYMYYEKFSLNLNAALMLEPHEIIVVSHIPLHPMQYNGRRPPLYSEMTPMIWQRLAKVFFETNIPITVISGHVHGNSAKYHLPDVWYMTSEGILVSNVALPTAILYNQSPLRRLSDRPVDNRT